MEFLISLCVKLGLYLTTTDRFEKIVSRLCVYGWTHGAKIKTRRKNSPETLRPVHTERHNVTLTSGAFDLFDGHYDGQNGLHAHLSINVPFLTMMVMLTLVVNRPLRFVQTEKDANAMEVCSIWSLWHVPFSVAFIELNVLFCAITFHILIFHDTHFFSCGFLLLVIVCVNYLMMYTQYTSTGNTRSPLRYHGKPAYVVYLCKPVVF